MKTITKIETKIADCEWLLPTDDTEDTDFAEPNSLPRERLEELCKRFQVSQEFIIEINEALTSIRDATNRDLKDIWERLDRIEAR